eukprot:TRINITY_DN2655_c0_g2_i1.p1 TRINITY_DN2655_c0_g2~~TRINITY_DN2655_c0_g2_i1.p1  ORF type:complete len:139 (+),score=29.51 TRINITY_DN2655_c0_g2_i1:564-980(+)
MEKVIKQAAAKIDAHLTVTICGSYRRGAANSGDIDVLITHPSYTTTHAADKQYMKLLVAELHDRKFITDDMSHGAAKYMGVCVLPTAAAAGSADDEHVAPIHRRIDIRIFPNDQYACAVLYFTGSDMFNRDMRYVSTE